jgi:hypothetical protein
MPKDPEKSEWYFEECPADEAYECCNYEYARESTFQKDTVAIWRADAKRNKIEDYLQLSFGVYNPPPGTGTYAFFPSWPDKPFLSIPENTRKEWYDTLGISALVRELFEKPIEPNSWNEDMSRMLLKNYEENGLASYSDAECQYTLFAIRWAQNDHALTKKFQSWLKDNRPRDTKPNEMRGRGNPVREWRLKLKYLSLYRLLKTMSISDAIAFLSSQDLKLKPYMHYQDWKIAVRKAEEIIRLFDQPPRDYGRKWEAVEEYPWDE